MLELGDTKIDLSSGLIVHPGAAITRLSGRELDVLAYLASRKGEIVQREELLADLWGMDRLTQSRALDITIARLRKKLELDPSAPRYLLTVHGTGYRLVTDVPVKEDELPLHVVLGELVLDLAGGRIFRGIQELDGLTDLERRVVLRLVALKGQVISGRVLAKEIWGWPAVRALAACVRRIKKKLRQDPNAGACLEALSDGYRLELGHTPALDGLAATLQRLSSLLPELEPLPGLDQKLYATRV